MKVSALIPVKGFSGAKQRLASRLTAQAREQLAKVMVQDVLSQVQKAKGIEDTYVVTGSSEVIEWVSSLGVRIIREPAERGETEAVEFALAELKRRGSERVLVMPGDLPLLRACDVECLLERASRASEGIPAVTLVPSHDRMGTNALLLAPPDIIRLRFGHDSFSYHLSEAASKRVQLTVMESQAIGLDIDQPEDLERFLALVKDGNTLRTALAFRVEGCPFSAAAS